VLSRRRGGSCPLAPCIREARPREAGWDGPRRHRGCRELLAAVDSTLRGPWDSRVAVRALVRFKAEKTVEVMYFPRKTLFPVALVVGLFGTPGLGPTRAPGVRGGVVHLPVTQVAGSSPGIGRRRRVRGGKVRSVFSRAVGSLPGAAGRVRPAAERIRSRWVHRYRLARGPPRSDGL
jgi:hypothetical protein